MDVDYKPNYSKANNVKYYLDGIPARRWCFENRASYSSYWRLKQEGYSNQEIKDYLQERYIDRVRENTIEEIAAYIRSLYLNAIQKNQSVTDFKKWVYSLELSEDSKDKIWDLASSGKVKASTSIELWKKIETTNNCFVSNLGNFRKKVNDKVLQFIYPKAYKKQRYNRKGNPTHYTMHIKLDGKEYSVAKLVATYFIHNPYGYNYTYIMDGEPSNLAASNIKWISKSEAGRLTGHLSTSKPVRVRIKYSKNYTDYRSVRRAAKELNVSYQTLLDYMNKNKKPKNSVLKKYIVNYI